MGAGGSPPPVPCHSWAGSVAGKTARRGSCRANLACVGVELGYHTAARATGTD
jgi:hypothetical protein